MGKLKLSDQTDGESAETWHGVLEVLMRTGGFDGVTDVELLTLVLGTRTMAEEVLSLVGGELRRVPSLGVGQVMAVTGSMESAARFVAGLEVAKRARLYRPAREEAITSSRVLAAMYAHLRELTHEEVHAVFLDSKQRRIGQTRLSSGTASGSMVCPQTLFREALKVGACGIVLVHNHPSGDPLPSEEDIRLTSDVSKTGSVLGVALIDHVVLAADGSFSFLDAGMLRGEGG